MLEVLSKPIDEITIADIQSLIDSEVPEGEQIEFKREPQKAEGKTVEGKFIPWMTQRGKVGRSAQNKILKEVVAFANTYGGVLLIGIDESNSNPAVADKISPVPRCADLAERLKNVFRDCVEPKLTRIDIDRILIQDKCECDKDECGCGVVIIRVGKSRLAPHRVETTLVCPIRRGDQCQKMRMREIQDMTLNVSRGLERLDKRLLERSERFKREFGHPESHKNAFGIRFTAAPVVDEVGFDRVFQAQPGRFDRFSGADPGRPGRVVDNLNMQWYGVVQDPKHRKRTLKQSYGVSDLPRGVWQPLLRGARVTASSPGKYGLNRSAYGEIYCDGLLELGYVSNEKNRNINSPNYNILDPDLPIVMFANLAVWADHIRKQAGAPTVEYALEVETRVLGGIGFVEEDEIGPSADSPTLCSKKFPTYSLNDRDGIAELLTLFYRDFWNSMGEDFGDADFVLG